MTGLLLALVFPAQPAPDPAQPSVTRPAKLLELHRGDAAGLKIYHDDARSGPLTLLPEPIFRWNNPTRNDGQEGDVFLWTYHGRPEALGSIFSHPLPPAQRRICHEFHSLSDAVLVVDREGESQWTPKAPGVVPKPVPGAPMPARTAPARMRQMQSIAREFSAESEDERGEKWELRLLPRPLYRMESAEDPLLDSALFGFVTSAGTDLELLLLIESRAVEDGKASWQYSAARFSDLMLRLRHRGVEVWSVPLGPFAQQGGDPLQRYRLYGDRTIDEIVAPAAP